VYCSVLYCAVYCYVLNCVYCIVLSVTTIHERTRTVRLVRLVSCVDSLLEGHCVADESKTRDDVSFALALGTFHSDFLFGRVSLGHHRYFFRNTHSTWKAT
jgi:hypothetical protein